MSTANTMHADPESSGRHLGKDGGHPTVVRTARLEVAVTREMFIPGDISDVFDFVAAQDVLPKILTGYGLVPGVASTSNVSGPWDQPGSTRTVHLLDGSTVSEGITHYDRPSYFAYRVSNPSFSLKHLMSYARGQFWFTPTEGGTQVKWIYMFRARNSFTKIPLRLFVGTQWRGYMDVCLKNVAKHFANLL
ncbi:polyketide cyclase/dehydrase/lipid transport protein [Collimonas sp. PA-H2]|uniref:SRPBCC family protein n=1 Tax=Collimonas sp. PA-H2 TaxID=1881062 RepID=UPI000C00236A|nr:SRPBCC family protein [Collimonas sp. PA-H2]PFH08524.1 polyketide cyclase/dehydrase/lipid transport protein [Collimonas sp. PA-H2]